MAIEKIHQKQEAYNYSAFLAVRIYDKERVIIKRLKLENENSEITHSEQRNFPKNISDQVRNQKDKVISQSLLQFGTIHRTI